jgi:phosphatidylserine synthase 2
LLGLAFCRYFGIPLYDWRGAPFRGEQLNRLRLEKFEREKNRKDGQQSSGKVPHGAANEVEGARCGSVLCGIRALPNHLVILFVLGTFLVAEVDAFYLKSLLWIPPSHVLNWARMWIIAFMGLISVADIYRYATDLACRRLGFAALLMVLLLTLELCVVTSFSRGEFPTPVPGHVLAVWCTIGAFMVVYPALQYSKLNWK